MATELKWLLDDTWHKVDPQQEGNDALQPRAVLTVCRTLVRDPELKETPGNDEAHCTTCEPPPAAEAPAPERKARRTK